MIFPGVGDHGIHMLPGDLQHGGHTRGDTPCHSVHPDYETPAARQLRPSEIARPALSESPSIIAAANFRPVAAFAPRSRRLDVEKSAMVGNLDHGSQLREQLQIRRAR